MRCATVLVGLSLVGGCSDAFVEATSADTATTEATDSTPTGGPIPVGTDSAASTSMGTNEATTTMPPDLSSTGVPPDTDDGSTSSGPIDETTTSASSSSTGGTTVRGATTEDGSSSSSSTDAESSSTGGTDSTGGSSSSGSSSTGGESSTGIGTSTGGSSSSSTGASDDGPVVDPLPLLPQSDEFDDPDLSAANWLIRHIVDGEPAQYDKMSFGEPSDDFVTVVPNSGGWYDDLKGPYIYQLIDGDFMVEAYVEATHVEDDSIPPTNAFNSAGLLIRDPLSVPGDEDWVLHHLGMHNPFLTGAGIERKQTVDSSSEFILAAGEFRGRIRLCRIADEIYLTRKLNDEAEWILTGQYTVDFTGEVQIGMSVTSWNSTGQLPHPTEHGDLRARWDYMRFWAITDAAQCLQDEPVADGF